MKKYVIGIDVGTTGTKAMVIDLKGTNLGSSYRDYPFVQPQQNWVELEADNLLDQVFTVTRESVEKSGVDPAEIAAVSFSVQRSSVLLVDEEGKALENRIMVWLDTRADEVLPQMDDIMDPDYRSEITGMPSNAIFGQEKLYWWKEKRPDLWNKARYISTVDGYAMKAFGTEDYRIDVSSAQTAGLIDVRNMGWNYEILDAMGMDRDKFPKLAEPGQVVGHVSEAAAARTGLTTDTLIVVGAGDQQAGALGAGVIDNGDVSITIGTGGFVIVGVSEPKFREFKGLMVSTTPNIGVFEVEGNQNSGATCYRWAKETFCDLEEVVAKNTGMDPFDLMGKMVEESSRPGSNGVIFSAGLFGTGYPTWNSTASGAFIGLRDNNSKADILRSVMEGVTLEARFMLESVRETGVHTKPIITITGGATKSPIWKQIMADVMGVTCRTLDVTDAPLIGVAGLAAYGAGLFKSKSEIVENMVHFKEEIQPIPENVEIYNKIFNIYKKFYYAMNDSGIYDDLTKIY